MRVVRDDVLLVRWLELRLRNLFQRAKVGGNQIRDAGHCNTTFPQSGNVKGEL